MKVDPEVARQAKEAFAIQRQYMSESLAALGKITSALEAQNGLMQQQNGLLDRIVTGVETVATGVSTVADKVGNMSHTISQIECASCSIARTSESAEKHLYRIKGQGMGGKGKW